MPLGDLDWFSQIQGKFNEDRWCEECLRIRRKHLEIKRRRQSMWKKFSEEAEENIFHMFIVTAMVMILLMVSIGVR